MQRTLRSQHTARTGLGRGGGSIGRSNDNSHQSSRKRQLQEESSEDEEAHTQQAAYHPDSDGSSTSSTDHISNEEDQEDLAANTQSRQQMRSRQSTRTTRARPATSPIDLPTPENYQKLGQEWGQARADEVLSKQPHIHPRISPAALAEALALQSDYHLNKTMLCIAYQISRNTLDEKLNEGALAQEPNSYNNYQTYSVVATQTKMPPKGVSEGFPARNVVVGNTWSTYGPDEQAVFSPRLFERLAKYSQTTMGLTHPSVVSTPAPSDSAPPASLPGDEPLTPEEIEKYMPHFKQLVNMKKLARDFKEGYLFRHSGQNAKREKLMMKEIDKVVRQLQVLHRLFRLEFHLLLASWNPQVKGAQALFQDEHTSCARWAEAAREEQHLLECFAHESTKAPADQRPKKKKARKATPGVVAQADLRKQLKQKLNELVGRLPFELYPSLSLTEAHLSGASLGRGDAHPKGSNPHLALARKRFRGDIRLKVQLGEGLLIDEAILAKGAKAGKLNNREIQLWLDDIQAHRYTVVKVTSDRNSEGDES